MRKYCQCRMMSRCFENSKDGNCLFGSEHPPYINRFIPGSAGNARPTNADMFEFTVYPRLCGERGLTAVEGPLNGGLSPALRGTLTRHCDKRVAGRFIPGFAGNACSL